MRKKNIKYYLSRLKKFFLNPVAFLKVRKLVDVKLLPNPDANFIDSKSIKNLYNSLIDPYFIELNKFLKIPIISNYFDKNLTMKLGLLFDKYGSDKGSYHGYHHFYQPIITQQLGTKDKIINLIEVGIGTNNLDTQSNMGLHGKPGASARAFRDFSSNLNLTIGDIDKRILFKEERIDSYFVDQLDISSLEKFFSISNYDLAIDDGLHLLRSNLNYFVTALEHKSNNSWIIIEDIAKEDITFWQNVSELMEHFADSWVVKSNISFMFISYIR